MHIYQMHGDRKLWVYLLLFFCDLKMQAAIIP